MRFFTPADITAMVDAATQGPFAIPREYYPCSYDDNGSLFWIPNNIADAFKHVCDVVAGTTRTVGYSQLTIHSFGKDPSHHAIRVAMDNFMKVLHATAEDGLDAFTQPKNKKEQEGKTEFPFPMDYLFEQMAVQIVDESEAFYYREGGVCFENTSSDVKFMVISLLNWLAARSSQT